MIEKKSFGPKCHGCVFLCSGVCGDGVLAFTQVLLVQHMLPISPSIPSLLQCSVFHLHCPLLWNVEVIHDLPDHPSPCFCVSLSKSISITSYTPLGWCVGFLGAFLRVLTGRVIAAALSRSRLLDPSQSAEDLGLSDQMKIHRLKHECCRCYSASTENTCITQERRISIKPTTWYQAF